MGGWIVRSTVAAHPSATVAPDPGAPAHVTMATSLGRLIPATDSTAKDDQPPWASGTISGKPSEPAGRLDQVSAYYGPRRVVREVALSVRPNAITAIIGPSGCGKSTLLRCINRMHELTPGAHV